MSYKFDFRRYHRPFKEPFKTAKGDWSAREGIIVRLEAGDGQTGFGEIAPLPSFGTESIEEAERYCESLGGRIEHGLLRKIPLSLPCCQFGFSTAKQAVYDHQDPITSIPVVNLLPSGHAALVLLTSSKTKPAQCYKWKIGVDSFDVEARLFDEIINTLPSDALIRLDANGGLNTSKTKTWLDLLETYRQVDFLEQPLANGYEAEMRILANTYKTELALDESVCRLELAQRALEEGWQGVLVLKPAIMGEPKKLIEWARTFSNRLVCSSVFETGIGWNSGIRIASEISKEPAGYDTQRFFPDDGLADTNPHKVWDLSG